MEYGCGGDLASSIPYIKSHSHTYKTELPTIKNILWHILLGLEQIHNLGYVYRDLKPANIIFSHDGYLKLCDFGFVSEKGRIDSSICGTPEYIPP